jgi:MFS family permease
VIRLINLRPSKELTEQQVESGLKLVINDGLAAEAMTALTGGTFLVAMALMMGASNFQIGILAALPTFTNLFQLLSIWLVRKYNNRRAIAVICAIFARVPLLIIGSLPLLFSSATTVEVLIFFLFFYYFFGSIAGPNWNSWMKDLVPENRLGSYFSHRTRLTQTLNVVLSISIALMLDFVKKYYPDAVLSTYACMFIAGGMIGLSSAYFLSRTPEPESVKANDHIFKLFKKPLLNKNFRNLLIFNSAWVFALNIATPFFTVYMMKTLGLPLSYIIGLGILTQLSSIVSIKVWGRYADSFSNKTIIAIGAPLYICCIIAWCFVGISSNEYTNIGLLAVINIITGIATAGINLSLTNIGLKLAPKEDAIVYLSSKNIITAFFSSIAPLIGGLLADFFANRQLNWNIQWGGPNGLREIHLLALHQWNFLFLIGATLAMFAVRLLNRIQETGEVEKDFVVKLLRSNILNSIKENFIISYMIHLPSTVSTRIRKTVISLNDKISSPTEDSKSKRA